MRTNFTLFSLFVFVAFMYSNSAAAQCTVQVSTAHYQSEYAGTQAFTMPANASFSINLADENSTQAFVSESHLAMSSMNIDKNFSNYPHYTFTNTTDVPQVVYLYTNSNNSSLKLENVQGMSCSAFVSNTTAELKTSSDSTTIPR